MSSFRSPPGIKIKPYPFGEFQGLDSSRDITALDTGRQQHLVKLNNGYCDWRGQIVREPTCSQRVGQNLVTHINFISKDKVIWAERTGSGMSFRSENDHTLSDVYPSNANISSTVFNQRVHVLARALRAYYYDGTQWQANSSPALNLLRPAHVTSIQRRVAVAGITGKETQIHLSRVDQDQIFPDDEDPGSANVLRAAYIDLANLTGKADGVTGLATFETNRLVAFTSDKALLYRVDPDINNWTLDERANINIGCISHNTIQAAGTDVLFCSRNGIHSIKRSIDNGIMVYSYSLSDKIDILYRNLLKTVENFEDISAVFNQDEAQYHIFFPQANSSLCTRLTLSLNVEGGEPQPKFSTGTFLNARCGAFLAGQLVFGTPGGVYDVNKVESEDGITPDMEVVTPFLWHGSTSDTKDTHSIILQASGKGTIIMDAKDDAGRIIGELRFEVDDSDDNQFEGVPLSRQYERAWQHRYRGAMYRFRTEGGSSLLRITGFAITVKQ